MTRPRTPASAMTTSLPRPRSVYGIARARANRTRPRSSKALCAAANRSAGPADPHRREAGERLVAGRLHAEPALDLGPGRGRRRTARRPARSDGSSLTAAPPRGDRARSRPAPGSGRSRRRDARRARRPRRRRPGAPTRAGGRAHRERGPRDRRGCGRLEERVRIERLVLDEPGGPGLDERLARSPAGGRRRAGTGRTTSGSAEGGGLGERRRAGAADDEVGRGEGGGHLVAQERERPVAVPELPGSAVAGRERVGVAGIAGRRG